MVATRVPTEADFAPLLPQLAVKLSFPSPPESTTSILLLFHGLGDAETPFAGFAHSLALPGVLGIAVRGTSALPPALLGLPPDAGPTSNFHWGDDITVGPTGDLDPDPGFEKAAGLVMDRLVRGVLVGTCGWQLDDVLMFGYGQGGQLALGLASRVRGGEAFKGVVSLGGGLPPSMVPSESGREKATTPVLVCHGRESEAVDEDAIALLREEFADARIVQWKRASDGMPESRDEVLPMMQFLAERLDTQMPAKWS
ncbi:phospholipase/Carboxylesterase superfamily protein [Podospora appendiculata]|uniref:Phospholipase/Carboxylesterase superfamily protein n=1 Tax=Podospora appendiculata TaxID=314037 RepID=A0AAE0X415_9PEZI|nr:phospholipase/Carboxylesterase superfamily protein [Podospora appendiculata]